MTSIRQKFDFDYEKKRWGATPIKNLYTNFQGLELSHFLKDVLPLIDKNRRVFVDSGCGAGNIPGFFKDCFPSWDVVGIDISKDAISAAKRQFPSIRFIKTSAEKLPFKDRSVDIITSFDTLEHYENLHQVLDEVYRALKDDGIFFISVPLEREFPTFYWLLYTFGWRGKMHYSGHVNFFTHRSLIDVLSRHGFNLVKKRFAYHLFFSIADIGYYFLQSIIGNEHFSFETKVYTMEKGAKKTALTFFKEAVSAISYIESTIFQFIPGGKGHFVFQKVSKRDFFSDNPPVTVIEDLQQEFGLHRFVRPKDMMLQTLLQQLKFTAAKTIADFGCANGIWLERVLKKTKAKGFGLDVSQKLIDFANNRKGKKGTYLNNENLWPLKQHSIDLCFSLDTFEHLEKPEVFINHIYQSLKTNGSVLIYTLNPNNAFTFDWLFEKFGSDYLYKRADHDKKLFIHPKKMKQVLEKVGFTNVSYRLYDGPFNLFWDVFCYLYLGLLEKLTKSLHIAFLMHPIFRVNHIIVTMVSPINSLLDKPFHAMGYSNGYFIWARK